VTDVLYIHARPQADSSSMSVNARHTAAALAGLGLSCRVMGLDEVTPWDRTLGELHPRLVITNILAVQVSVLDSLAGETPDVEWVVRCHSNLPAMFTAPELVRRFRSVVDLAESMKNVRLAMVDPAEAMRLRSAGIPAITLPNVFTGELAKFSRDEPISQSAMHLSAMFAPRVLKNPAAHVLAAAAVARQDVPLVLHISDQGGNMPEQMRMLAGACGLSIMAHPAMAHHEFTAWLAARIDVGLQLSYTDSYNWTAMEHLALGIPCVTSTAVNFSPWQVAPNDALGAARAVLEILRDYAKASAQALEAARHVQRRNSDMFAATINRILN